MLPLTYKGLQTLTLIWSLLLCPPLPNATAESQHNLFVWNSLPELSDVLLLSPQSIRAENLRLAHCLGSTDAVKLFCTF